VKTQPLLQLMAGNLGAKIVASEELLKGPPAQRQYNHLVVVGLLNDPVVQMVWLHEAKAEDGGLYVFGFGHLKGDIGYAESGRNPFLHGIDVKRAPFEAELVTLTGTSAKAVAMVAQEFVQHGLVNGVVAAPGWTRGEPSLLDRDPLLVGYQPPAAPATLDAMNLIGLTQPSEDEYRNVLADTGVEPVQMWRCKYYRTGAWDGAGVEKAIDDFNAGLHKRAWANTLWSATFASADEAQNAAGKIAAAANLNAAGEHQWAGTRAAPATSSAPPSPLVLWQRGATVFMADVPAPKIPQ